MNKNSIRVACLLMSLIGTIAWAQDRTLLNLDEAMDLGIQNSKYLKIDQAKIDEAMAQVINSKNHRLPDFKISGSALALANAKAEIKILPPSNNGNHVVTPSTAYFGSANFSLPLYSGGRINYGIQSAQYLLEASKLSAENNKLSIAYTVAQAYNNLYKSEQVIKILKENLKAAQERDKTFLNLENNGVIARNDRLKANLQTADIELKLLEAENNFEIAMINMDLLLGLPENTQLSLDSQYISSVLAVENQDFYMQQAMENRKDLQVNDYQQKAAKQSIKAAKSENLPQIALTAGYVAAEVPKIMTLYNAANIGIGVQYNLSNIWKKNTDLLKAEAQIQKLDANQQLILDQIKLEIHRDYKNYQLANSKIGLLEKSLEQANENFRITKNKFDNGLETITNLLEADAQQITAHVNLTNAKADAVLAFKKLEQTSGILISK
ncbi:MULTISPECIES: TolC family protein [Amniculibacterium]|uniref:TolC family protein n=1 Tax=Amniculibacterium TaxID=2715289 RepID=UPI000F5B4A00|nr:MULTISPECIES: TolC family protein [Amniculibacterium]